jgi:hypothetical protein
MAVTILFIDESNGIAVTTTHLQRICPSLSDSWKLAPIFEPVSASIQLRSSFSTSGLRGGAGKGRESGSGMRERSRKTQTFYVREKRE